VSRLFWLPLWTCQSYEIHWKRRRLIKGTNGAASLCVCCCLAEYRGQRLGNGGIGGEEFQQLADLQWAGHGAGDQTSEV
jgi:hypothetical protein